MNDAFIYSNFTLVDSLLTIDAFTVSYAIPQNYDMEISVSLLAQTQTQALPHP
jgi:hypothetical protein